MVVNVIIIADSFQWIISSEIWIIYTLINYLSITSPSNDQSEPIHH